MKLIPYDAADYLDSDAAIKAYLDAALELGDPAVIAKAMGDIARARGMTSMARASGIKRETLYRAFSAGGNPELETFFRLANALGVRLCVHDGGRSRKRTAPRSAVRPKALAKPKARKPPRHRPA